MPRLAAICGYLSAFLVLCALTWLTWQYRFEALQDEPALTLGHTPGEVMRVPFGKMESDADGLHLKAATDIPRMEFRWREHPRAKFAHIRIDASCDGVALGKYRWDDARLTLMWIGANGKLAPEYLPLWAAHGDRERGQRDIIVPLSRHATLPKIVISNRGSAGEFVLHSFSVQPVEWRPGMRPAIVLLVFAWFAWAAWGIRHWVAGAGSPGLGIVGAAALWVAFGWYSSLPGPWLPRQSIGKPLPIDVVSAPAEVPKKVTPPAPPAPRPAPAPAVATPAPSPSVNPAPPAVPTPAPAPVPEAAPTPPAPQPLPAADEGAPESIGGGPIRWLLAHMPALKKVAHLAGFALLTALLGLLTGNRRAIWPALALAGLSEFCQWAFGFGFGWDDVLDLLLDTASVMLGLALWLGVMKWQRRKVPPVEASLQSPAANT